MSEHVDPIRLQTDLTYRFQFLSNFIEFTQNDIRNLNQLLPIINSRLPVLIDAAYRKLFSFDITKQYFYLRHDGFETFTSCNQYGLTLDYVQTEYRKDMLTVYFQHILSETDWNETFLEYLLRVGQIHTMDAGSSSINIDYMYMNALLSYIEQLFMDTIWNTESIVEKFKYNLMKSLKKFFYIQNDFLTMIYQNTWKGKRISSDIQTVKFTKCWFM